MALCASGNAPNISAFHFRGSVVWVSGQCGVPQWPGTTKLSRSFGQQRGHVSPPVAALDGNGTSLLYLVRCSVVSASGHGGVPPCPSSTRLSRGVSGLCSVRPLRPPASLLHNAAFCKVQGSRSAKAPLGAPYRFAPFRVCKTGVMQSGLRWRRSPSRRRFPVAGAPYAPPSARPCGCLLPTLWPLRCAALILRWSVRPPPRGFLSPAPGVTPPNGGGSKTSNLWCKSMYLRRYSAGMERPRKKPAIF
ncbi:hypothetical protein M2244_003368 [Rhodoferax antarcticus]|nr:hypothetical protein [Rhodoferax antarcticus]